MKTHNIKTIVLALAGIGLASLPTTGAFANPLGAQVVAGNVAIQQESATKLGITQTSNKAIVDWRSFSIGANEYTQFYQPSASSVILNRVVGEDPSQILGRLTANGQVFLVNPNGIYFGKNAQIDVASLVASTHNIRNEDFLAGRYNFNIPGKPGAAVINEGTIRIADTGIAAFVAPSVANRGVIVARLGKVAMAAANGFTLDFTGDQLLTFLVGDEVAQTAFDIEGKQLTSFVENSGRIEAQGGYVLLTAKAAEGAIHSVINQSGSIEARTVENKKGEILLLGGKHGTVEISGQLDASAPDGGDGGFVETSGADVRIADTTRVTTTAPYGKTGTWLIDPNDYTIAASGGNITGAALSSNLGSTSVSINTATQGTAGGNGDIFVNDAVSWSANNTLTLSAVRNVNVNANITATGNTAGLTLTPNTGGAGGGYSLKNGASITLSGNAPSLTIAGTAYTVINSLGLAGDTSGSTLQGMNGNLAGHYALGSNIDAAATSGWNGGAGFMPIGSFSVAFTGAFTGLGHTINNLFINRPTTDNIGLFGSIWMSSIVQNVGLVGGSVSGGNEVGGLVGFNQATVSNSYATCNVSGNDTVGGLVGINTQTISNSYTTGSVIGRMNLGGMVGDNRGTVTNSHFNVDSVTVNGSHQLTTGGLYNAQYLDWFVNGLALNIANYSGAGKSFMPVGGIYTIGNVQGMKDMLGFVDNPVYNFGLSANIDLAPAPGLYIPYLRTNFDGAGFTISNLNINQPSSMNVGMFGLIDSGRSVSNVGLVNASVSGGVDTGGLVGSNLGTVSNSYATGSVSGGINNTGGLVGGNTGTVINSYATGNVSGNYFVGGLVGQNGGTIIKSYATGSVSGDMSGGLLGLNWGTVTNSHFNVDSVTVNGSHQLTTGGLYNAQYLDWFANGLALNIANYSGAGKSFMPVGGIYTIGNVQGMKDMLGFVDNPVYNFGLSANIDLAPAPGLYIPYLRTNFDGAGFTISNLHINQPSSMYLGMFGLIDSGKSVSNVGLVNASVSGGIYDGGMVGLNRGSVVNSYSTGNVGGLYYAGGLVGEIMMGSVVNSYSTASVSGSTAGGLVGLNITGTVDKSNATGSVSGNGGFAGGLVGYNGGIVSNSYWDIQTSGQNIAIGLGSNTGATGLTTAQMKTMASFTGWDIANTGGAGTVWRIYEGNTTPLLSSFLKPLTISADAVSAVYTGTAYSGGLVNPVYSPPNPDSAHLLGNAYGNATNAGTYAPAKYSDQQGYDISYVNGALTITPASVMLASLGITASNASKTYGTTLTFNGTEFVPVGLLHGDTISRVTLTSAGAVATANAGSYAIVPSAAVFSVGSAGNYTISYVNGVLKISAVTALPSTLIQRPIDYINKITPPNTNPPVPSPDNIYSYGTKIPPIVLMKLKGSVDSTNRYLTGTNTELFQELVSVLSLNGFNTTDGNYTSSVDTPLSSGGNGTEGYIYPLNASKATTQGWAECVSLVVALKGVPWHTADWTQSTTISVAKGGAQPGDPIATFNTNGKYTNEHTAVFVAYSYDEVGHINGWYMLDQSNAPGHEKAASIRFYDSTNSAAAGKYYSFA